MISPYRCAVRKINCFADVAGVDKKKDQKACLVPKELFTIGHSCIFVPCLFIKRSPMLRRILTVLMLAVVVQPQSFAGQPTLPAGWIRELFTVNDMIQAAGNVAIKCSGENCKQTLACDALVGVVWAEAQKGALNQLKDCFTRSSHDEIANVMVNVANDCQVACLACKQYAGWTTVTSDGADEQLSASSVKNSIRAAFALSSIGKKLRKKIQRLKQAKQKRVVKRSDELTAVADERLLVSGQRINPNMNGVYQNWLEGYQLPQVGRGVLQFTLNPLLNMPMPNNILVAISRVQDIDADMYEIALGTNGNTAIEIRTQPQGSPVASACYSITDPITLAITFDNVLGVITIAKVEADGSTTVLLEYDDYEVTNIQYVSFTGCDSGGRITNVSFSDVVYPAATSITDLEYLTISFIQSAVDDKYLMITDDGYVRATLDLSDALLELEGFFVTLTDGQEMMFIGIDMLDDDCGALLCLPPGNGISEPYVVLVIPYFYSDYTLFTLSFDHDIVYIKNLVTGGYMSSFNGQNVTTGNLAVPEAPTSKGVLQQLRIRPLYVDDLS